MKARCARFCSNNLAQEALARVQTQREVLRDGLADV